MHHALVEKIKVKINASCMNMASIAVEFNTVDKGLIHHFEKASSFCDLDHCRFFWIYVQKNCILNYGTHTLLLVGTFMHRSHDTLLY